MRLARILPAAALIAAMMAAPEAVAVGSVAAPSADPLAPATAGGLEVVDQALAKLSTHRRLLVVGAHPDDEDNALLTWVSRGLGGEAAYLSLSRGEGGQNLIGTELGVGLGVIRTGELEAARRIEGTRQYFARAYDFGYTRSLEETLSKWPREVLLQDAMRAIRRFKPQVIVAVFPGDARAGHGQHQASGLIAREAFAAAREGVEFSSLDAEDLADWAPQALYQRAWSREQVTGAFDLGVLEPVTGRSLAQIASASRSRHRSQDMGREQRLGHLYGGVVWEAGAGQGGTLFDGIDTRLAAIAGPLGEHPAAAAIVAALDEVATLARATREELSPTGLSRAVDPLTRILGKLDQAIARLDGATGDERVVLDLLREKRGIAARALLAAAEVMLDASADRERLVPGEDVGVTAELWSASSVVIEVRAVELGGRLLGEEGVLAFAEPEVSERTGVTSWRVGFAVSEEAQPTIPYYLRRPRRGDLYDWSEVSADELGAPRERPELIATFDLEVAGIELRIDREVVHRYGDQAVGEVRRPLRVVPPLEIEVTPDLLLWNRSASDERAVQMVLRSNVERQLEGEVRLGLPSGWQLPDSGLSRSFALDAGREAVIDLPLTLPAEAAVGRHRLAIEAAFDRRGVSDLALPVLEYPHIVPTPAPRAAEVSISVFDLALPDLDRVGYVVGASDRVPGVLRALGLPLEVLTADDLSRGDLDRFDAIVVGSRAYEIDPALAAANARLLDFARRGGTLVVQYQQYQFVRGQYAPFALSISRPHGRVTDEGAPMRVLAADHPALRHPNAIGEADWSGWVQERGLYFAESWDESFTPLLATADVGRAEERGALLVAELGEGVYVYSGLSFFRQLPAGVPGAIRLFVNLLALGGEGDV